MIEKEKNVPKRRFKEFENADDWEQRKLGDVTTKIGSGKTPLGGEKAYKDYGVCLIRSQNINFGTVNFYDVVYIDDETDEEMKNSRVLNGDVLLNITGASIGRSAVYHSFERANVNQHVCIIRTICEEISPEFIHLYLTSNIGQSQIASSQAGGAREGLNFQQISKITFLFPKIEEQSQIGTFFTNLDNLITLHQRKLEKMKALKKAYLTDMFPAEGESKPKLRFAGFTDDWEQRKLEDLCSIVTKQTGFDYSATIKPSLQVEVSDTTYPFIQNKDFSGMNINLDTDFFIPKDIAETFPKILLDKPSILISISGKIGNVGFYRLDNKAFIGGAVGICKLLDASDGVLIVYELLSDIWQVHFSSLTKASSHANITVEDIRKLPIKVPKSIKEKELVGMFFSNLDNIITLHQRKLEKLQNIKKAYLNEMFI